MKPNKLPSVGQRLIVYTQNGQHGPAVPIMALVIMHWPDGETIDVAYIDGSVGKCRKMGNAWHEINESEKLHSPQFGVKGRQTMSQ